jgi:hypothetical protein
VNWIVGTAILWVLKLITIPFAKLLAGDRVKKITPVAPVPTAEAVIPPNSTGEPIPTPAPTPAPAQVEEVIPNGYYILADVIVLGVAGGLMGLISGYYFIGFSFKPKDWPGMIVFIISSLIGSLIHG